MMNLEAELAKLKDTALFEDNGESLSKALITIFRNLNDEKAIRNISIHLRADDQSKVFCVEFVFVP